MPKASDPRSAKKAPPRKGGPSAGRSLAEFGPLSDSEGTLLNACRAGEAARISDALPTHESEAPTVRAEFIRFLALGGDEAAPVHERGVQLAGAVIVGALDLSYCKAVRPLHLMRCRFSSEISVAHAEVARLTLSGSLMVGLYGDGLQCPGGIFLRNATVTREIQLIHSKVGSLEFAGAKLDVPDGDALSCDGMQVAGDVVFTDGFTSNGTIRLLGAIVVGDLVCTGSIFNGLGRRSLSCERAVVRGSVFFRDGFSAKGLVSVHGARIDGNLDCTNGRFETDNDYAVLADQVRVGGNVFFRDGFVASNCVSMRSSEVHGSVDCSNGTFGAEEPYAIDLTGANIRGRLKFKEVNLSQGVNLEGCQLSALTDDFESWSPPLVLHGLRFDRIDEGPTDTESRLAWLRMQRPEIHGGKFWPQPWEHLAKILREMGHVEEAKTISINKQRDLRKHGLIGNKRPRSDVVGIRRFLSSTTTHIFNWTARGLHRIYGWLAGFGYRPLQTVMWMISAWLICAGVYHAAEREGYFGPTAPLYQTSTLYESCGSPGDANVQPWTRCEDLPAEHIKFSSLVYSMDVALPLVDLRQESEWTPIVPEGQDVRAWAGAIVRLVMWMQILFGWITSLLLVSALGRLVQKD